MLDDLPTRGNYTLIILLAASVCVKISDLGVFSFKKGCYAYTGSAMGNGAVDLRHRVARHLRQRKTKHWHIDYLLASQGARITGVVASSTSANEECQINRNIQNMEGASVPIDGFGASDCKQGCGSHLAYCGLGDALGKIVAVHRRIAKKANLVYLALEPRTGKMVEKVQVTVEQATIKHLKQLVNLERECFTAEAYTEKQISRLLKDPKGVVLLAWVDDDIAGFIIGLVEDLRSHRLGHVVTIDVALRYRRKGIGSILLDEMEATFLQRGAEAVYLEVRVDNKSARQLYARHGYNEMGALEDYYSAGTHGLRLIKRLVKSTSFSQL